MRFLVTYTIRVGPSLEYWRSDFVGWSSGSTDREASAMAALEGEGKVIRTSLMEKVMRNEH